MKYVFLIKLTLYLEPIKIILYICIPNGRFFMNDSRAHILKIAVNLFLLKSYRDVTLKEIVEKSGLSKGAFYHYFESKEVLFKEVVEHFLVSAGESVYVDIPNLSLRDFISSYLERMVEFLNMLKQEIGALDASKGLNYFSMSFDALRILSGFSERIAQVHHKELAIWMEVVRNAKASGEITTFLSDAQVARLFISTGDGRGMHMILEGKIEDVPGELFTTWNGLLSLLKGQ
jgi:TetR/AcrR family transcriptional regulator, transcriptional repressor for nem operon